MLYHCLNCNKDYDYSVQGSICPHKLRSEGGKDTLATPVKTEKIVRIVRTVEYIGPEDWVENVLRKSFLEEVGVNKAKLFMPAPYSITLLSEDKTDVPS